MKVLFDTNVIIDFLTDRYITSEIAQYLNDACILGDIKGYLVSKQYTDIHYILRKYCPNKQQRKNIMKVLFDTYTTLPFMGSDIKPALSRDIDDFEDAVIEEIAKVNCMDYIVTNNAKDFVKSRVNVILPEELLKLIKLSKGDF